MKLLRGLREPFPTDRRAWITMLTISVVVSFPIQAWSSDGWDWHTDIWREAPAFGLFIGLWTMCGFVLINKVSR
ncbi:hypothetical protein [Prauserella cavernicola]|uniref:Uncharacterized protein n=1 Tax=Prauserella cavernicola TaxID=2800127 RepID=A0A934QUK9_9PSEU|nr:hypothetical protein [Prauserella cavernicola]MBK1785633.1 hypothetical protein [Prauserella cavernicola]